MLNRILASALLLTTVCMADQASTSILEIPQYNNNVFAEASFIYWLAKQEGNDYAATGAAITVPGTVDPNTGFTPNPLSGSGHVYAPNTRMKPGFKVALGVNLAHDKWDVVVEYTYLHSTSHGSVASNNLNAGILPIFNSAPNNSILASTTYAVTSGATGFVAYASGDWNLDFNNMNFELGRNWKPTANVSLRPHFGLQSSWQTQHFDAFYQVNSFTTLSTILGSNTVSYHQDFWSIGLRAGLDSTWQCCNHFGLFANSAISGLWGQFTSHSKTYDTYTTAGYSHVLTSDQKRTPHTLSPVVQLEIGAQTDWDFNDKYRFILQAGWEGQIWFFQNQHSSTVADTSLIMQGLTVNFRFDF